MVSNFSQATVTRAPGKSAWVRNAFGQRCKSFQFRTVRPHRSVFDPVSFREMPLSQRRARPQPVSCPGNRSPIACHLGGFGKPLFDHWVQQSKRFHEKLLILVRRQRRAGSLNALLQGETVCVRFAQPGKCLANQSFQLNSRVLFCRCEAGRISSQCHPACYRSG